MKLVLFSLLMLFSPFAMAAVSLEGIIAFVIWIVVVGLILYVLWWLIGYAGLPAPFDKVARVLLALVGCILLIYLLLGMLGPMPRLG